MSKTAETPVTVPMAAKTEAKPRDDWAAIMIAFGAGVAFGFAIALGTGNPFLWFRAPFNRLPAIAVEQDGTTPYPTTNLPLRDHVTDPVPPNTQTGDDGWRSLNWQPDALFPDATEPVNPFARSGPVPRTIAAEPNLPTDHTAERTNSTFRE